VSLGFTCPHLCSLGFTLLHLVSVGLAGSHLSLTWNHLESLDPLGLTWTHLDSTGLIVVARSHLEEGKTDRGQTETGRGSIRIFGPDLARQCACSANETKRFPGWTHPPAPDIYIYIYIFGGFVFNYICYMYIGICIYIYTYIYIVMYMYMCIFTNQNDTQITETQKCHTNESYTQIEKHR
jgi:hypothetical protein